VLPRVDHQTRLNHQLGFLLVFLKEINLQPVELVRVLVVVLTLHHQGMTQVIFCQLVQQLDLESFFEKLEK
jgi:hypothetical protein